METPLSLRLQELRPKLVKISERSGLSQAELVRLAVFELTRNHKTVEQIIAAQIHYRTEGAK